MFFPPLLQILRQILLLYFLDDIPHLDGVIGDGIPHSFLFPHDLVHGILVQQLEVLTFLIGYLLLEDMFEVFIACFCYFLSGEKFLIGLLLCNFIAPIVHPLHSVKMRARDESSLHLNPLQLIVMLLLQQLLCTLSRLFVDLLLLLLHLPHLLDVLH